MKVMILTTHINVGGIGVYTTMLARHLKDSGVEPIVVSAGGDLEPVLAENGIRHITADIRTKSEFGPKMWKSLPFLARTVREEGIDLVHAQTRVCQVAARLLKKISKVPYVATCHGFFNHRRVSRRIFPCWGDRTIAISSSVKQHLAVDLGVDASKIDVVYNGIETSRYMDMPAGKDGRILKDAGFDPQTTVIGALGRLSVVKGYTYLVEAFSMVLSGGLDCRLMLVGEGPEKKALREKAERLGVSDKVIIVPGGGELKRFFSVMDVFCMPSLNEGLGLALMEAMASGRSCVASRIGGLAELIDDGDNGLLVPPADPGALAGAIERVLGDRDMASGMAAAARKKAMKEFDIKESVDRTIGVYEKVMGKREKYRG